MIEDFFHLSPVLHLELRKTFEMTMALMVYSGPWGKLIHEKNQKSKISLTLSLKLYPKHMAHMKHSIG
jgi:hypothetical protein